MCGRFTIVPTIDLHDRFRLPPGPPAAPRYNIAPGQEVPVIIGEKGNRALVPMTWGLVVPFGKGPVGSHPVINARAETLLSKPAFRDAARSHRCLVPASGFYEWKAEGRRKIPFYIRVKAEPLFALAGIYRSRRDPAGVEHATFAIITTEPNEIVSPLHDRMPAILRREDEGRWIGTAASGTGDLTGILGPYPATEMEAYPVSGRVNDPGNEGPGLILPLPGLEK